MDCGDGHTTVNLLQATELCTSVGGLYGMWTVSQENCIRKQKTQEIHELSLKASEKGQVFEF